MTPPLEILLETAAIALVRAWYTLPECCIEKISYHLHKRFYSICQYRIEDYIRDLTLLPEPDEFNSHKDFSENYSPPANLNIFFSFVTNKFLGRTKEKRFKSYRGMFLAIPESEWAIILSKLELNNPLTNHVLFWINKFQEAEKNGTSKD